MTLKIYLIYSSQTDAPVIRKYGTHRHTQFPHVGYLYTCTAMVNVFCKLKLWKEIEILQISVGQMCGLLDDLQSIRGDSLSQTI
jgi:hypothetical protein